MGLVYSRKNWRMVNVLVGHPWGCDYIENLERVRDSCKDASSTLRRLALTLGAEMCRILHKGVICSKHCYRKMNLVANGLHWGRSKVRSHLLYGKWIRITEEMERKGEDTERGNLFVFILCSCGSCVPQ